MERDLEYENNNIAFDHQYIEEDGGGYKPIYLYKVDGSKFTKYNGIKFIIIYNSN
jgi:hypothetical protein